ncbi:MAG: TolC family protein [Terriglobales bacterium]
MNTLIFRFAAVVLALIGIAPAAAQSDGAAPSQTAESREAAVVQLQDLIQELAQRNPEVRAAQFRFEAASKRPLQVSTLPDPRISYVDLGVGHPFSALNVSDFAYRGVGVAQEVPFPGKLALAGEEARKEAAGEEALLRTTLLDVISRLKLAYYEWFAVSKAIEITNRNRELMERFERIARARYAVGKGIQQDVLKAQVELSGLAQQLEVLQQRRGSLEAQINALLNRPASTLLGRPADVKRSTFDLELNALLEEVTRNSPRLQSRKLVVEGRKVGVDRAKKEYFPDFNFGFEWQRSANVAGDYYMVRAEARVPLYFWRKQRLGVEEAKARLQEAEQNQQATLQELLFSAKDRYLVAKTSERLLALYEAGIIPQAALSLESATAGYEVGNVDFLTLINNFTTLLNFEMQYYEELARHEQALSRLEPLVARQMTQ